MHWLNFYVCFSGNIQKTNMNALFELLALLSVLSLAMQIFYTRNWIFFVSFEFTKHVSF